MQCELACSLGKHGSKGRAQRGRDGRCRSSAGVPCVRACCGAWMRQACLSAHGFALWARSVPTERAPVRVLGSVSADGAAARVGVNARGTVRRRRRLFAPCAPSVGANSLARVPNPPRGRADGSGCLRVCSMYFQKLMGVEAFLAHHHAGDVGPPPAWGGIADDGPDAPCAVAGMFGCAPMNSTYDYWKNGVPWEGPPVVYFWLSLSVGCLCAAPVLHPGGEGGMEWLTHVLAQVFH